MDPAFDAELAALPRRRFTLAEYHQLIDAGVLGEDDHVELLCGAIVEMTPQHKPHAWLLSRLNALLVPAASPALVVRIQLPLTLSGDSEPEPDIAVVTAEEEAIAPRHPRTAILIIESSGESLRRDRVVKAALYAQTNVAEYWIADVKRKVIEVYRDPDPASGRYRSVSTAGPGELLQPLHLNVVIPVAGVFLP